MTDEDTKLAVLETKFENLKEQVKNLRVMVYAIFGALALASFRAIETNIFGS